MLSKSLIQFSVDGQGCVPSLLFDLRPTMVEKMKIMTSFKRSCTCTAALIVPDPAPGHCRPHLHQRLLDTHRQVWLSLLWGHCSFLLGPGAHKVLSVPSKCLFPQFCNQIPLAFKVTFPRGSQSLSLIPRLGNLLWALELLQQLKEFFDIILSSLWVVCSVALLLLSRFSRFQLCVTP